jgi:FAD/FMN-containing dehydrogenase
MSELTAALIDALGADAVLTGGEARERMAPGSLAATLVLPRDTAQVSRVLALCHAAGRPLVAQGGLTGLVHGAVSGADAVVLSFDRMRRIEEVDVLNRCMTVQAGVPLQAAQAAAEGAGLMLPLDLGARGTATIGGNVSTNAGGTRVLRFGMMRDMVLGLEAVLADGTVIDARSKIIKNNTGYDLKQLFVGSEGTLGVVTRVVLRLRPLPASQSTALVALEDFSSVTRFLSRMEAGLFGSLSSFEVMWRPFYDLVTTPPARGRSILGRGHAFYVLVETLGVNAERDGEQVLAVLAEAEAEGLVSEAVVAQNARERREMWALRDDVEQLNRYGPALHYDVSLALDAMERYVAAVQERLSARFGVHHSWVFGHLADGNLHVVVRVEEAGAAEAVHAIVYGCLPASGASVSAEHGIGLLRKPHLPRSRSAAELELMRVLKRALDPKGILNPGKIFDVD